MMGVCYCAKYVCCCLELPFVITGTYRPLGIHAELLLAEHHVENYNGYSMCQNHISPNI